MPITGGCQCCLVIVALFISPLAVAFATSPACNSATYLNTFLYVTAMLMQGYATQAYPTTYQNFNGSFEVLSSGMGSWLVSIASILNLLAFIHAVCVICGCAGTNYQQLELGKHSGEHGEYGAHPMMPKNLSVQSSYMICDCRGAKGKNGLVKVRVPRGMVQRRNKGKQAERDKESNGDLSTDSSFELEKTHMRRAMMPYVSRENHEGKRDYSAGESEGDDVEKGTASLSRRQ